MEFQVEVLPPSLLNGIQAKIFINLCFQRVYSFIKLLPDIECFPRIQLKSKI